MVSERIQRRIERLLDRIDAADDAGDWQQVVDLSQDVLAIDEENREALAYRQAAERQLGIHSETGTGSRSGDTAAPTSTPPTPKPSTDAPNSFGDGRYQVKEFLGEGGKKLVYLAHDGTLDRDVAFALIKTDGLDKTSRTRITHEAQAMGRLGAHPHIVTLFELGDHEGQPYIVSELMGGGAIEELIEDSDDDHGLPLEQALELAKATCRGLEFAHSKGIVHRDLKPGNVWLTAEGTAKIGDFGLAVATDRSRLTQEGMMVGTVAYMPPEQAMGGEVTAQADLYSLGAMLYEMVTGRPPFVGDDSVAIIGQHLNTPPVAPTWHNPDVPPALETLVLRLLEKDPSARPAAADVLEALDAIDVGAPREATSPDAVPTGPDPTYRHTFVGRENELRQLHTAFDNAMSGKGSLVMVVGEPGIGKTTICEQLATYAKLRGGMTLVGHCYEEGSLSLPYLAFVEAMRCYVLDRDADGLRSDLGSGASEVARIVSEVRERLDVGPSDPSDPGDPEQDRYRLMQAVTSFLTTAAAVQPLVIVLEDLHDADSGTLDMLTHVSRNLSGAQLMLVGTYRDVEVDRSHPLSGVLAELRRIATFDRIGLRGLTADEVQRMMGSIAGHDMPWGISEAVYRQTEGNPLFVQEVLRYLVEEGVLTRGHDGLSRQTPPEMRIPDGEMAAERAILVYASGEAVRLLEQALQVQEVLDPDDRAKRCDLLLALGEALMPAGEPLRAAEAVAPGAFDLAEELDDNRRRSAASMLGLRGLTRYGAQTVFARPEWRTWAERADRFAAPETSERVFADSALSWLKIANQEPAESHSLAVGALELARRLDDPQAMWNAAVLIMVGFSSPPQDLEGRIRLAQEVADWPREGVAVIDLTYGLWICALLSLVEGNRDRAEALRDEVEELGERTGDGMPILLSLLLASLLLFIDGQLEESLRAAERSADRAEELGLQRVARFSGALAKYRTLLYVGKAEEALALADQLTDVESPGLHALCLGHLGRRVEAQETLDELLQRLDVDAEAGETPLVALSQMLELAVSQADRDAVAALAPRLACMDDYAPQSWGSSNGRNLGAASALLGDHDGARAHYQTALEVLTKVRHRPEIALTRLELAELLLDHYPDERAEALEHLDFAITELRDMKMQPALERALSRREILEA